MFRAVYRKLLILIQMYNFYFRHLNCILYKTNKLINQRAPLKASRFEIRRCHLRIMGITFKLTQIKDFKIGCLISLKAQVRRPTLSYEFKSQKCYLKNIHYCFLFIHLVILHEWIL